MLALIPPSTSSNWWSHAVVNSTNAAGFAVVCCWVLILVCTYTLCWVVGICCLFVLCVVVGHDLLLVCCGVVSVVQRD